MAIGPDWYVGPSPTDLATFWGDEAPTSDTNWTAQATARLTEAADLFFLVTGLREVPSDPRAERLIQYAIMDMATALYVRDPSETNSPYSSERIGSYSYTLKTKATQGVTTGVFWWDLVVDALTAGELENAMSLVVDGAGEDVFHRPFGQFTGEDRLLHPIPLVGRAGAFEIMSSDPSARQSEY